MSTHWDRVDSYLVDGVRSGKRTGNVDVLVVTTEIPFKEQIALMEECGFVSDGDNLRCLFGGTIDATKITLLAQLPFIKNISENTANRRPSVFTSKPREVPDFSKLSTN